MEETDEGCRVRSRFCRRCRFEGLAGDVRVKGRRLDLVVYLLIAVGLAWYTHHSDSSQTHRNCLAIENLKDAQVDKAAATIKGDRAFLKANPGGTASFPEAVVRQDIADNQATLDRFPPRSCP